MTNSHLSQIHETLLTRLDARFRDMQAAPSEGKMRTLKRLILRSRGLLEQLLQGTTSDTDLLELQILQEHLLEQLQQTVDEM